MTTPATPADPFADFPYTLDQVSDAINAAPGDVTIFDLQAVSTHIQDYRPGVSAVHDGTGSWNVYQGDERIGSICYKDAKGFTAYDLSETPQGNFYSLQAAANSLDGALELLCA
ncbi:MAG: hypothetical protein AAFY74_20570 [Pseudomonadota bacterium]